VKLEALVCRFGNLMLPKTFGKLILPKREMEIKNKFSVSRFQLYGVCRRHRHPGIFITGVDRFPDFPLGDAYCLTPSGINKSVMPGLPAVAVNSVRESAD
jgi:hypothetical protein